MIRQRGYSMEINEELNKIIMSAYNEANSRQHEYLTPEHLLYASLFFDKGKDIIEHCGGDVERMKANLEKYFEKHIPVVEDREPMQSIGFLSRLEFYNIITPTVREVILDRAMALESEVIDLDQMKWVAMMVLYNQPGRETNYLWLENLLFDLEQDVLH